MFIIFIHMWLSYKNTEEDIQGDNKFVKAILDSFNTNYEIVSVNHTSNDEFYFILRTELPKGESPSRSCDMWKEEFGKLTHSSWIVKETFPSPLSYVYRKIYTCQHSSLYKSTSRSKEEHYTKYRDKECHATIDIKIQKVTKDTKKKHPYLKEGRTATIKVKYRKCTYTYIIIFL